MPPGPYTATTCRGKELNYGSHTYFFDHTRTWRASRMSDQPNSGATSETAQTWMTIHNKHTLSHPNKANMEWWLRRPNDIRGSWGLKFPDICLTGDEKPRKNLTQETSPYRDRTRARFVTSAHATTYSTAVDHILLINLYSKTPRLRASFSELWRT